MADPVLVFDLDGMLIHSAPEIHAVSGEVLADEGLAPLPFDLVQSFVGNGLPVLVGRILSHLGRPASGPQHQRMVAQFEKIYSQRFDLTMLYPGVAQMLTDLAPRFRLAICTNKPSGPTRAVLAHFGLTGLFAAVIGGDSLPVRKPAPLPLLEAIRLAGGGPAIFVGDSEVDAETARAGGVPFALFTEGYRKTPVEALPHDFAFARFADLPALVARVLDRAA